MARKFVYDNREFADIEPGMSVEEVQQRLADFYPDLTNATFKKTKRGKDTVYTFNKRVGTKGASLDAPMDRDTLAGLIERVPETRLDILALVSELTQDDGGIDMGAATARGEEVRAATAQASRYVQGARQMREALSCKLRPLLD